MAKYINLSHIRTLISAITQRFTSVENELNTKVSLDDIPQSDWNQNTSINHSYVANRTHYLSDPTWQTIYSGTLTFNETSEGFWSNDDSRYHDWAVLVGDNTPYKITYGFYTYSGILTFDTNSGSYLAGNRSIWYEEETDTGEPFIMSMYFSSDGRANMNLQLSDTSYQGTVDLYIYFYIPIINKLDSKYLNGKTIRRGTGYSAEIFNVDAQEGDSASSRASGAYSHCEGAATASSGDYSHCEGSDNVARGNSSHCEGEHNESIGAYSHCEGLYARSIGSNSHCEGYGNSGSIKIRLYGDANVTKYDGLYNLTDRHPKSLIGSSIGNTYITDVGYSGGQIYYITVAETLDPEYSVNREYRIYNHSRAYGDGSHCEGELNTSYGIASHSEGSNNVSFSNYSHAEGRCTIASSEAQHVQGRYNIEDTTDTYAHIVGNGWSNGSRSNAHTLDWNGNGWYAGKLTVGSAPTNNMDVATKQYVDSATSGITTNLSGLTDTTITSPSDGQVLTYDNTNAVWVNADVQKQAIIVTVTGDDNDGYTADKTYAELKTAVLEGSPIILRYSFFTWHIYRAPTSSDSTSTFYFGTLVGGTSYYWTISSSDVVAKHTLYAVSSVNGQTGAVTLSIPTKTSDLTNDSGFVTTDTNTTYTISISGNIITLTPSTGTAQTITLPVYNGGVT